MRKCDNVAEELENLKSQIKDNIVVLVNNNKLQEAQGLLNEYVTMVENDLDSFSMQAVIDINQGRLDEAKVTIEKGLLIEKNNFDLLYNLASVHELKKDYKQAANLYSTLKAGKYTDEQKKISAEGLVRVLSCLPKINNKNKQKLVFFVKSGMDSFLGDIIEEVSDICETKKIIVTQYNQIDEAMSWCDICWFEWCDELIIHASKLDIAKEKKLICRLHSYEAFTDYPTQVYWDAVDKVIFVAEHIRDAVLENVASLSKDKTIIIPNGINVSKYSFKERKPGFKIAYLGYINYKKGPMLLLHTFKAIFDKDQRYKLYMAGTFQDNRDVLYFRQMIEEMGLTNNVFYEGWQNDVNKWLDDKDYIICTSVLEGHPVGVMEAMAKGIKPLIHNFVGARKIFPEQYLWNTISECTKQIRSPRYSSQEYREAVQQKYSKQQQIEKIIAAVSEQSDSQGNNVISFQQEHTTVSVIIPTYNRAYCIEKSINSALQQTYPVLEVLVCDDGSTDNTEEIVQAINDDRVKFIKCGRNGRPAEPRNIGIRESKGDWIGFLDSDDEWLPTKIELQIKAVQEQRCKAVCSDAYRYIPEQGNVGLLVNINPTVITFNDLVRNNWIACSTVLIHRSLLEWINGFTNNEALIVGEDYAYWLRVLTHTNFAFVAQPLLVYSDSPQTSIRSRQKNPWATRYAVFMDFLQWAQQKRVENNFVSIAQTYLVEAADRTIFQALEDSENRTNSKITATVGLIFSKDRAMQLEALLASFFLHCSDPFKIELKVLYAVSDVNHEEQYKLLEQQYPQVMFVRETNFYNQVKEIVGKSTHILFLVDDCIFVRNFSVLKMKSFLDKHSDVLGVSLRLGKNTTYCYPANSSQKLPDFKVLGKGMLKFDWRTAEHDFGYPLEVSSSIYRSDDIIALIDIIKFVNPNQLEGMLACYARNSFFMNYRGFLVCQDKSIGFCVPVNIVQQEANNRYAKAENYSVERLRTMFANGDCIDVEKFSNFTPDACHQEKEYSFKKRL